MEVIYNELEPANHLAKLKQLMSQSDEIVLCSGWIKIGGLKLLSEELDAAIKRNAAITVISNKKDTDKRSRAFLKKRNLKHITVDPSLRYFHTKLYYFKSNEAFHAIIGSANLTEAALTGNEELSTWVTGRIGDDKHKKISLYLDRLSKEYLGYTALKP
jgi:HKD family nuclease